MPIDEKNDNLTFNFIIGTKAQFIKTIPVINEFLKSGKKVKLYDLKQHSETTSNLREKIIGKYIYIELSKNKINLGTYSNLILWFFKTIIKIIFYPDKNIKSNYCFVHGDTLSTLLGSFFVKRNRGNLVLLEAGHPVPGIFKHFPESVIRYIVAKISNKLIVNGESQINQLKKWNVKGSILQISTNTIYDSFIGVELNQNHNKNKVTVAIHRTENINNKIKLKLLVKFLVQISERFDINWYLHIPTRNKLKSYNLLDELTDGNVKTLDLIQYDEFINELYSSEFVVTDGAGIVEECQLIGVPTLVWRDEHLDQEHLFEIGNNLVLSNYQTKDMNDFLENYNSLRSKKIYIHKSSPSKEIYEHFIN